MVPSDALDIEDVLRSSSWCTIDETSLPNEVSQELNTHKQQSQAFALPKNITGENLSNEKYKFKDLPI